VKQEFSKKRIEAPQPLDAANHPNALLRISTVCNLSGLSRATIYRLIAERRFVEPVRLSARCTRFRAGEVTAWLAAQ
jgi:prophage regulatory protein